MGRKQRLDLLLVELGLVASRHQAQQLIRAGRVRLQGRVLDKPGQEVDKELVPELEAPPRFVSRGGEKLAAALQAFPLALRGRICLDAGISTGGFTDCLLQNGAARVYGIDVGYGQTAWSLRSDERVVLRERTNLRHLDPADLYRPEDPWPDLGVADLSFIALARVLPALRGLLRSDAAEAVVLVKPQFEVGRERVGKGGVVRDPRAHVDAIAAVIAAALPCGWSAAGLVASPLTGPAGNHEYLLWLRPQSFGNSSAAGSEPRRNTGLMGTAECSQTGELSEECGHPQHPERSEDGEPRIKAENAVPAERAMAAEIAELAESAKLAAGVNAAASGREAQLFSMAEVPNAAEAPHGAEKSSVDQQSPDADRSPDAWLPRRGESFQMNTPSDDAIGQQRELAAADGTLNAAAIERIVKSALR